jgi:MFS family permease
MSNIRKFSLADLEKWADKNLITRKQLKEISAYMQESEPEEEKPETEPRKGLNMVSVAYYFGAFTILLAYSFFVGIQWADLGEMGQVAISFFTIAALWVIGYFLTRKAFRTPGNLLIFAGTAIVPLLVYSVLNATGLWVIDWLNYTRSLPQTWIAMGLVSLAVAIVAVWVTRFPLISVLISFWIWRLSMDVIHWVEKSDYLPTLERIVSVLLGLGLLLLGIFLQKRAKENYSIWFYIFGHLLILVQLSSLAVDLEGGFGFVYLTLYLVFVVASIWLQRTVFLVFGAIGFYFYLSYLAFEVFHGALGFVYALGSIGLLIIFSAVGYQKYLRGWLEERIGRYRFTRP